YPTRICFEFHRQRPVPRWLSARRQSRPTSSSLQPQVGSRRPQAPDSGFEASSGTRTRVADTVTVVTTRTATDTDVATSALFVTPFRQISTTRRILTVDGEPWTTVSQKCSRPTLNYCWSARWCEVCPNRRRGRH
uniref:Laminin N-terminal domain-containing protein n=1 Tax=Macrostomum lignano TaxID=282301 RepID=A0A1I8IZE7_9PLAT